MIKNGGFMNSDNLAKLQRLKQDIQKQNKLAPAKPSRLTADDFKSLAKTMGVAEYAKPKISVKRRKKPKFKKKNGDPPVTANPPKQAKQQKKKKKKINPADTQSKPKRKDWIKSRCTICRAEFVLLPEWKPRPVLCKSCRNERKNTAIGKRGHKSSDRTNFTSVSIFQGGSPGGGKRR